MVATTTDQIYGVETGKAMKVPVRVATTANITLSGEQTIDGVAVVAGDRVLVWQQTSAVNNGVYDASATAWSRAIDFDGPRDLGAGTRVFVTDGSVYGDTEFQLTTTGTITVGTSELNFSPVFPPPIVDVMDYIPPSLWAGIRAGTNTTDLVTYIQAAADSLMPAASIDGGPTTRAQAMTGGGIVRFPAGLYRITSTIYSGAYVTFEGDGMASFSQMGYAPGSGKPNGTVIYADFGAGILADAPIIHISPWVLQTMAGQTVGERYVSSAGSVLAAVQDVDAGKVSYCDGASIKSMTLVAATRTFCGIRNSAGSCGLIENVAIKNVKRGILGESNWESAVKGVKASDVSEYGYYGTGGQHSIVFSDCWWHGALSSGADPTATAVYMEYGEGCQFNGNSVDDMMNGFHFQTADGAVISGSQMERIEDTVLIAYGSRGIRMLGGTIYNPTSGYASRDNFVNSTIVDGNDCEILIDGFQVDHPEYGSPETFPGRTFRTGTNPITSAAYGMDFAGEKNVTLRGFARRAVDTVECPNSGQFTHEYNGTLYYVGNETSNNVQDTRDVVGASGVSLVWNNTINGDRKSYRVDDADESIWYRDSDNGVVFGFNWTDNYVIIGPGSARINGFFGTPEGFVTGSKGDLSLDNSGGLLWVKASGTSTNTGWLSVATATSPALTGTPTAPTAAVDTNTTQIATTAFVVGQAGSAAPVMDGAAAAGTSLRYSRQDHVHPTDTSRAPLASPALTGTPTAPTAAVGTDSTQIATTAFVADNTWTLIEDSGALGSVATYTKDSIGAGFNSLRITYSVTPATDGSALWLILREGAGSDIASFDYTFASVTAAAAFSGSVNAAAAAIVLSGGVENTTPQGVVSGVIYIHNIQSANYKSGQYQTTWLNSADGALRPISGSFQSNDTGTITGVKLQFSAGNIASGRVRVEGC